MKKTTKLLVLMMMAALVFACFAFFAYAAEDEESIFEDVKVWADANFESMADDYKFDADKNVGSCTFGDLAIYCTDYQSKGPRGGSVESFVAKDGTKSFAYFSSNTFTNPKGASSPYISDYVAGAPSKTSAPNSLSNTAYYSLDFDLKSPTGYFDGTGNSDYIRFQTYFGYVKADGNTTTNSRALFDIRTTADGYTEVAITGGPTVKSAKKSDEWQHYTVLFQIYDKVYADGTVTSGIDAAFFLDGEKLHTFQDIFTVDPSAYYKDPATGEPDTTLTCFREVRINLPSNGSHKTQEVESVAIDNWKIKSFSKFYKYNDDLDNVMTGYIDLGDWKDAEFNKDYKYPFGNHIATVLDANGKLVENYDSFKDAFAAAEDGYTVKIHADVTAADGVVVNKNITVDANFDRDGNKVDSPYAFEFVSDKYSSVLEDGIYLLKRTQNSTVKFFWDMPIKDKVSPTDNALFMITTSVLDAVPVYPDEIDEYFVKYGEGGAILGIYRFDGWSYEDDGTPDTLLKVTEDDLVSPLGSWKALYAVYTQCDIKVTRPNGRVFYCTFDEIPDVAKETPNLTFSLTGDVTTSKTLAFAKDSTFDLAGFAYKFVSDDPAATALKVEEGVTVKLTSSVAGAKLFAAASVDGAVKGAGVAELAGNFEIAGENLAVYTSQLFNVADDAGLTAKVTINGGSYYRTVDDGAALMSVGGNNKITLTASDATFISATDEAKIVSFTTTVKGASATFTECCFIALNDTDAIINNSIDSTINIDNCKVAAKVSTVLGNTAFGYDTLFAEYTGEVIAPKNCKLFGIPETHPLASVKVELALNEFVAGAENGSFADESFDINVAEETELKFAGVVAGRQVVDGAYVSNCVNIEWYSPDGTLISTEYIYPGATDKPTPPLYVYDWADGDGWRDIKISKWQNEANEAVTDFAVPADAVPSSTVKYYGITPVSGDPDVVYTAAPKKLLWNISFGERLAYNFYIPKEDAVTINSLKFGNTDVTIGDAVKVGELDYYLCTVTVAITDAHVTNDVAISYTIEGIDYSYEFIALSALSYASTVLAGDEISDAEKEFILNYVRIAKLSNEMADNANAAYDVFFNANPAPDYITEYPGAALNTPEAGTDQEVLINFIKDVSYEISEDGTFKFSVTYRTQAEYSTATGGDKKTPLSYYIYNADETEALATVVLKNNKVYTLTVEGIKLEDLNTSFVLAVQVAQNKQYVYKSEYNLGAYINKLMTEGGSDNAAKLDFLRAAYALSASWQKETDLAKNKLEYVRK